MPGESEAVGGNAVAREESFGRGEAGTALLRRNDGLDSSSAEEGKLELPRIAGLPVQMDARVPIPDFRLADLLSLVPGRVIATEWPGSKDVPLWCGDVHLVWTEFEVVDQTLAVRVTRLV